MADLPNDPVIRQRIDEVLATDPRTRDAAPGERARIAALMFAKCESYTLARSNVDAVGLLLQTIPADLDIVLSDPANAPRRVPTPEEIVVMEQIADPGARLTRLRELRAASADDRIAALAAVNGSFEKRDTADAHAAREDIDKVIEARLEAAGIDPARDGQIASGAAGIRANVQHEAAEHDRRTQERKRLEHGEALGTLTAAGRLTLARLRSAGA